MDAYERKLWANDRSRADSCCYHHERGDHTKELCDLNRLSSGACEVIGELVRKLGKSLGDRECSRREDSYTRQSGHRSYETQKRNAAR